MLDCGRRHHGGKGQGMLSAAGPLLNGTLWTQQGYPGSNVSMEGCSLCFARVSETHPWECSPRYRCLISSQELLYIEKVTVEGTQSLWRKKAGSPLGEHG